MNEQANKYRPSVSDLVTLVAVSSAFEPLLYLQLSDEAWALVAEPETAAIDVQADVSVLICAAHVQLAPRQETS